MHRQQAKRHQPPDADSGYDTQSRATEDHDELDFIDSLALAEESSQVRLKHLLLNNTSDVDESLSLLTSYLNGRLVEGHGETLFDLGVEDNGDSMGFTKDDWDFALARLQEAAAAVNADCRILLTRNVGGEEEADQTNPKDPHASGKLMIRRKPDSVDDVIETRIAVVGNGTKSVDIEMAVAHTSHSRRRKEHYARSPCQGRAG